MRRIRLGFPEAPSTYALFGRVPLFACVGFAWFYALLLANAWVGDDAYISYRSMEQLQAGNGPVWNPHERVQVYTGVIWFWLGHLVRQVTDDYFLLMLSMSATCLAAALALLRRWLANDAAWLVLVLALTASRGLVDFGTSGLDYPLVILVAVAFMLLWRKVAASPTTGNLARLFMLASIVPLVRHDMALLVAPGLMHAMWIGRRCLSPGRWCLLLVAASLPLVCWTAFAIAYYGFPLPNTYYAKAARGIASLDLAWLGAQYYLAALLWDPATLALTLAGLALMVRAKMAPLAAGVALHMAYVLWVGGDFMLTRFFVADFVVAVAGGAAALLGGARFARPPNWAVLAALVISAICVAVAWLGIRMFHQGVAWQGITDLGQNPGALSDAALSPAMFLLVACLWALARKALVANGTSGATHKGGREGLLVAAALLVLIIADPYSPARQHDRNHVLFGVLDERASYADDTSVYAWLGDKSGTRLVETDSELYNRMALHTGLPGRNHIGYPHGRLVGTGGMIGMMFDVAAVYAVGMQGWAAGTEVTLVDLVGLGDPYLARTRYDGGLDNVIRSHWYTMMPRGYALRLVDGFDAPWGGPGTFGGDLELAVRSDDLFTKERWAAIARLNFGAHGVIEVQDPIQATHLSTQTLQPHGLAYVADVVERYFRPPLLWHHGARLWLPLDWDLASLHVHMPRASGV